MYSIGDTFAGVGCILCHGFPGTGGIWPPVMNNDNVIGPGDSWPGSRERESDDPPPPPSDDDCDCPKKQRSLTLTKGVILELFDPLYPDAYNTAVISFNRKVSNHNIQCPDYKVIPLNPFLQ